VVSSKDKKHVIGMLRKYHKNNPKTVTHAKLKRGIYFCKKWEHFSAEVERQDRCSDNIHQT